jgi:hypothetical protein
MFSYQPTWSDAAIRRFLSKVGPGSVDDLVALRAADNQGSGLSAEAGHLAELASRIRDELAAHVVLGRSQLAVDGNVLMAELGIRQGPALGRLLYDLTERVVAEPALNDRAVLIEIARQSISDGQSLDNP